MTIDEELRLSYYREIAELNREHCVFLVQHIKTNIVYVKKRLYIYEPDVFKRLIAHPVKNTPRIVEAVEDDGVLTVIEEYISGHTLADVLSERAIQKPEGARIILELCKIVEDLHSFSPPIIHRDIKPSNIIITADGTVKLLDMDAAKLRGTAAKDTVLMGTAGYAAPEQFGFGSSGKPTDVYAIGVVMAEIAHGELDRSKLTDSAWDRIIEKCTRIDPNARYSSAGGIIYALRKMLDEEDIAAEPAVPLKKTGWRYAPPGFRSKKPWKMIVGTLGYVSLILLMFGYRSDELTPGQLTVNRIELLTGFLAWIAVSFNYLDVWTWLRIDRIRSKPLRVLAAYAAGGCAFFVVVLISVIIELIFTGTITGQ